jgi:hypothetical protein
MSNPNFVNDLVMMAKAFEELPKVQAELNTAHTQIEEYAKRVQTLEMRLIDRANEIDNLNAKVRTVEVERDHAETMFLETDERLQALRGIFTHFTHSVDGFIKAVEPPKPEPVAEPTAEVKVGASEEDVGQSEHPLPASDEQSTNSTSSSFETQPTAPSTSPERGGGQSNAQPQAEEAPHSVDPTSAPSKGRLDFLQRGAPDVGAASDESAASSTTLGESAADPTPATESSSTNVSDALASPQPDDVGYHNEPKVIAGNWHDWDGWCARMNARYGTQWPPRAQAAQ